MSMTINIYDSDTMPSSDIYVYDRVSSEIIYIYDLSSADSSDTEDGVLLNADGTAIINADGEEILTQ